MNARGTINMVKCERVGILVVFTLTATTIFKVANVLIELHHRNEATINNTLSITRNEGKLIFTK